MKCSNRHGEDAGLERPSDLGYGCAGYRRKALPNAVFIGLIGTPIEEAAAGDNR